MSAIETGLNIGQVVFAYKVTTRCNLQVITNVHNKVISSPEGLPSKVKVIPHFVDCSINFYFSLFESSGTVSFVLSNLAPGRIC